MKNIIVQGDCLSVLKTLPDNYVQMVCTSPPYYGLRDYSTEEIIPSRTDMPDCAHEWITTYLDRETGERVPFETSGSQFKAYCNLCDAFKKDQQIGLESSPQEYIEKLVKVFREVRRVLRSDGTCWLNLGDSYAGSGKGGQSEEKRSENWQPTYAHKGIIPGGMKPKDLMMIPARVAIALCEDGWYLRQDCIWNKLNAMPESVTDRPTSAHEHVFLLAKSERYYYDADSIREPFSLNVSHVKPINHKGGAKYAPLGGTHGGPSSTLGPEGRLTDKAGRNKRSVWSIPTSPFPDAHFATMPPKLVEPCILAGSSPRACEQCGTPWQRVIVPTGHVNKREVAHSPFSTPTKTDSTGWAHTRRATDQWTPSCKCKDAVGSGKCIVLDPFLGSGTVAMVAIQHGRSYLGIELNPAYITLAHKRIATVQQNLWSMGDTENDHDEIA